MAVVALCAAVATAACGAEPRRAEASPGPAAAAPASRDTSYRLRPGYVVDSALSRAELLRRFREGTTPVTRLDGGAASREQLVRRLFDALARSDTAALRALAITRDEFAWLVFASSPLARPPYDQRPDVAWLLREAASEKGLRRLVGRGSGGRYLYRSHRCARSPDREGENRVWRGCRVRIARGDREVELRLFGAIVEHDGRLKLLGYDNDL